jgi:small nuclear ribonucleoprotein (snRNP)-like protein
MIYRDCANVCVLVEGTLKGYDALMNLVLDDVQEVLRGMVVYAHVCIQTNAITQMKKATHPQDH